MKFALISFAAQLHDARRAIMSQALTRKLLVVGGTGLLGKFCVLLYLTRS